MGREHVQLDLLTLVADAVRVCAVEGCGAPVARRGWCEKHLSRWRRHKNVDTVLRSGPKPRYGRHVRLVMDDFIRDAKAKPCSDCGGEFHYAAMDFDHVRGEKAGEVAEFQRSGNLPRLIAEIEKCDLVCANCHRVRTWDRRRQAKAS